MVMSYQGKVEHVLKAISDPTRRRILGLLAERLRTVSEIVAAGSISQPAVTKQLGVLERAGLVVRQREGSVSRCRLVVGSLTPALLWIESIQAQFDERLYGIEE